MAANFYTPAGVYLGLVSVESAENDPKQPSFLLESIERGDSLGRYSYIGVGPKAGVVLRDGEISHHNRDGTVSRLSNASKDPLAVIREEVSRPTVKIPRLSPFTGGYVGYLGYEMISIFEPKVSVSNPDVLGVPDAMLFNYDHIIAFDHARNEINVIGNIHVNGDLEEQYQQTTAAIDQIIDRIKSRPPMIMREQEIELEHQSAQSNFEHSKYLEAVEKAREYVSAGDVIQVVISQRFARKTEADPFSLYCALRMINPSPFMTYLDYGDFQIIGASPELLLRVNEGTVTTNPIAGTRPVVTAEEENKRLEEELSNNEKEKAEHRMLVDLGRNDVGRVSAPGTVRVPELMKIKRFSHVMHIASEVQGQLADQYFSLDALRSTFPAGTLSGAPKIRAMQIIDELEPEKRGPYGGVMGYIAYNGNVEMAITIRTMVYKDGIAYVQAGGGIVYDSVPEEEFIETINKAKASMRAIDVAEEEYV
ncbi:MAG: anthranilate synthase component I [Microgenomates group bacterium Gr01-1014_7]|nr:MAG: anthranilate synthase component I [Microgenomates group bacterium Gr01-1014_7]